MDLIVWNGDYGLVSMCPVCIRLILFTKLTNAPVKINYKSNPIGNPSGNYPVFRDREIVITDYDDCISYLRIKRYGLDFGLSCKECSLSYALSWLVMDKLAAALEYTRWVDQRNYDEFTCPWFRAVMPPIFSSWYTFQIRKKAQLILQSLYPTYENPNALREHLLVSTNECLSILNTRLGKSDYFFSTVPSSIDATVYAYLAPLLKIPLPSNEFACLLKSYPALVDFVKRIDNQYFSDVPTQAQFLTSGHIPSAKVTAEEEEKDGDSLSLRSKILVGTIVVSAMLSYAVSLNLIDVSKYSDYFG